MKEIKSWFECVDKKCLHSFAQKHHRGLDSIKVKEDAMIVSCSNPHNDKEWEEVYSPFGKLKDKNGLLENVGYAEREFFVMMYTANEGKTIDGKTYDEAWKDAHKISRDQKLMIEVQEIDEEIKRLNKRKDEIRKTILDSTDEFIEFADRIVKEKREQKSLVVKAILQDLTEEEKRAILQEIGYVPADTTQNSRKKVSTENSEPVIINNGLNEVVLDFGKSSRTEVDECDDYYV